MRLSRGLSVKGRKEQEWWMKSGTHDLGRFLSRFWNDSIVEMEMFEIRGYREHHL